MPQIHISLLDNASSRKLAAVVVHLPAATIEINPPDVERSAHFPTVFSVPALTVSGIAIWSTPDGPVVTFPTEVSTVTPPSMFGPSPLRHVLEALVDDIRTAYHDAARTTPAKPRRPLHAGEEAERPASIPTPPNPITPPIHVGDRVRVGRPCLGNPANAVAVCYEVYDRGDGTTGVSLLFSNGNYDGFSPRDGELFAIARIDHIPALASYRFTTVLRLDQDFRAGVFAAVWRTPLPDTPH